MRKRQTYFEQVPLEAIAALVEKEIPTQSKPVPVSKRKPGSKEERSPRDGRNTRAVTP
jgi:hypothetical protein